MKYNTENCSMTSTPNEKYFFTLCYTNILLIHILNDPVNTNNLLYTNWNITELKQILFLLHKVDGITNISTIKEIWKHNCLLRKENKNFAIDQSRK